METVTPRIETLEQSDTHGKFVVEPLEPGYGVTLGNSLRRVLLSSIEGAAITSVKIDGVQHEFQTIPGLKEDATELLLNLKELFIKVYDNETAAAATGPLAMPPLPTPSGSTRADRGGSPAPTCSAPPTSRWPTRKRTSPRCRRRRPTFTWRCGSKRGAATCSRKSR
jgi:hypothetical protein